MTHHTSFPHIFITPREKSLGVMNCFNRFTMIYSLIGIILEGDIMHVIDEITDRYVESILTIDPNLDRKIVEGNVRRMLKERLEDPTIIMDNNVTGDHGTITLTKLCSWIDREEPVISGNATFYCQPTRLRSPTSNMLKAMKRARARIKKEMFKALNAGDMDRYMMLDLQQQNLKVIMNAEYGGSGTPTAAFYTKYSPAATTLMAQSIITVMAAFFESIVGNNQKFFNINEFFDWAHFVRQKKDKIPKWVTRRTSSEVYRRLLPHFMIVTKEELELVQQYLDNLTDDELVYFYYGNNLNEFVYDHPYVQKYIREILSRLPNYEANPTRVPRGFEDRFKSKDEYNKWVSVQMFLDPNNPPEQIKELLDDFANIIHQMVFIEYITPDSIEKLNNHKRNTVILVDTDSNIINSNIFVSHVLNKVFPNETFGRSKMYNEMILVNVIGVTLSKAVNSMLMAYARCHNINDEDAKELTMKNEFMFRRLFLMLVKKRYVASIVLREGNIMMPFKKEIKGVNFIKADISEDIQKRLESILCNHLLFSDDIELHEMMKELKQFEKDIYIDLKAGHTKYLKTSVYKDASAYKDQQNKDGTKSSGAWKIQVYRGSIIWNELYPLQKINAFERVKILKLAVQSPSDLLKIKDQFPREYEMAIAKIFQSDNGMIVKSGLNVICIPANVKQIPEWLIPLIDYDILISDVISSFRSVLDALHMPDMLFKTPNGTANVVSCLINI